MELDKRRLGAILVTLLLLASGAAAYSTLFTAGSGSSYEAPSGLVVDTTTDHAHDGSNPFNDSETLYVDGVSISSSGSADLTVDQFRGERTELSSIDASSSTITVDPDDKSAVEIDGGVTALSWEDAAIDGSNQITYSADSAGTITATGLDADSDWTAATPDGELVDSGTTSSDGEADIDVESAQNQELILFENDAPEASNLSPENDSQLSSREVEFSVDITDGQFGSEQGDEVSAELYVDGESVGSTTTTENGTVSINHSISEGGSHEYYWVLEDSYGGETETENQTVSVPANLEILSETNSSKILDDVTVEVRFYGDESEDEALTVTRETDDGTIDMTGLPVNQPFVVVASADGYYDRRIFIESLYDQQEIYLLNDSAEVVRPTYNLEDYSGYYPGEDSVLVVQRVINGSYQTIVGDYFGAAGDFQAVLNQDVRHRLIIRNVETGRQRILGTTMATDDGEQIVRVLNDDEIELVGDGDEAPSVGPSLRSLPAAETSVTVSTYGNSSDSYDVEVAYKGDTEEQLASETVTGDTSEEIPFDLSNKSGGSVWVNITWTSDAGNEVEKPVEFSVAKTYVGTNSMLDWLDLIPGEWGDNAGAVSALVAVLLTVLAVGAVAASTPASPQAIGLVALAMLGGWAIIGWLSYDILFASTIGYVAISAIKEGL